MRNLASPKVIKEILSEYEFRFSKSLGQNFLIDEAALDNIVEGASLNENDCVLEIGAGFGTLTQRMLPRVKKVVCVEIDKTVIPIIESNLSDFNNLHLINDDILKVDLKKIIDEESVNYKNIKIVANLPYYITTPIIMKLLEEELNIDSITIMVQKEVADRIIETPGGKNSGAITYSVYYYAIPSEIIFVPRNSFMPSPEVDSKVIQLKIRKEPPIKVKDKEKFFNVIKTSFMQRRKTLLNGLCNGNIVNSKEEGKKILQKLNLPENIRGEKLTIEQYTELYNLLYENVN